MKKKFTPKLLIGYLIKEFSLSLLIFFLIFFSLILISSYIEEIIYFREKNLTNNFFLKTFLLTLIKTPSNILNMSPFIFLFSGIFFFAKLIRLNEVSPFNLSGLSINFITFIPAIYSFLFGILLIFIFTPISSHSSKFYETFKQKYSSNDNLIIISNTGLWLKEVKGNNKFLLRSDIIKSQDFKNLKNITIYKFNKNNILKERIDASRAIIKYDNWILLDGKEIKEDGKAVKFDKKLYKTTINLEKLKNFHSNSYTFSIWNIIQQLDEIRNRGYFGQELIITFNKYLSLPFLLFSMIVISSFFTIRLNLKFNNFIYAFFGVVTGIVIYFMIDLSIAIGKGGKIPLELSVWFPIILIVLISIYTLSNENEKY